MKTKQPPYKSREELEFYTAWSRKNENNLTKEDRRAIRQAKKKRNKRR